MSRKTVLTILYVTLGLILLVAAVWIRNEIRSREKMKELQSAAEDENAPFGPELSDVEKARFSHLDGEHVRTSPSPVPSETPYGAPKEKKILPRFEKLHEENPDLAGWLTIPGTVIDYPVMYLPDDNDFYLKLVRMIADDTHLEQMAQAVAAHDLTVAFENAHALKGVLANLALTPVLTPVQELTELLRARTEMDYTSLLQEARVQMDRLLALIRE